MLFDTLVRIRVGTDLSRPRRLLDRPKGRDKSVPTVGASTVFCQRALSFHT